MRLQCPATRLRNVDTGGGRQNETVGVQDGMLSTDSKNERKVSQRTSLQGVARPCHRMERTRRARLAQERPAWKNLIP